MRETGVRAASVDPVDWKYRRGFVDKQLPEVLGNVARYAVPSESSPSVPGQRSSNSEVAVARAQASVARRCKSWELK